MQSIHTVPKVRKMLCQCSILEHTLVPHANDMIVAAMTETIRVVCIEEDPIVPNGPAQSALRPKVLISCDAKSLRYFRGLQSSFVVVLQLLLGASECWYDVC